MTGGPRERAGRKPVRIDLTELEKLCSLQCTDEEIAAWFGVSGKTIANRRKQPRFSEVMERGRAKGRVSVRRAQMKLLEAGNATMGVWIGKQILGQRDVITAEHSGLSGAPIQVAYKPDLTQLTDEELRNLREIAFKAAPDRRDRSGTRTPKPA